MLLEASGRELGVEAAQGRRPRLPLLAFLYTDFMLRRITLVTLVAVLASIAWEGFFYFRDNLSTHLPLKVMQAEVLRSGEIPLWTRATGGGQPLGGNPNTLLFYPDTFLFLILPPIVAFNLHFLLHLVIGFYAMRTLLLRSGADDGAARWSSALYLLSGAAVSATAFYNLIVAFAMIPLAAAAATTMRIREERRDVVLLGLSCGLLGLAAEPVTMAATAGLLLLISIDSSFLRRVPRYLAAVALSLIIASPLLIAFSEIRHDVERSGFRYSSETVLNASLSPLRFLEIFVGPFQGTITDLTESGFGPSTGESFPQFLPSTFVGALALPALLTAWRLKQSRWLIALIAFAFVALGKFNPVMSALVGEIAVIRVARFPEKLTMVIIICAVVLIALLASAQRCLERRTVAMSIGSLAIAALLSMTTSQLSMEDRTRCVAAAIVGSLVLWLARRDLRRALMASVVLAAVVAVFTLPLDWRHEYEKPALARSIVPAGAKVVHRLRSGLRELPSPTSRAQYRTALLLGDPITGGLSQLRYVLDGSPDGMHSFFSRLARERSSQVDEEPRMKYIVLAGAEYIVSSTPIAPAHGSARGEISFGPNKAFVSRLPSLPPLHAPLRIIAAPTVQHAALSIESPSFRPGRDAVAPRSMPAAAARITSFQELPNGFTATINATAPATVVSHETWFRAWGVSVDGKEITTFPANIDRLGFVVPAGTHRIEGRFGRLRGYVGSSWALSLGAIALSCWLLLSSRSRNAIAAPAR